MYPITVSPIERCINCDARLTVSHNLYDLESYCRPCVGALAILGLYYINAAREQRNSRLTRKEIIEQYIEPLI